MLLRAAPELATGGTAIEEFGRLPRDPSLRRGRRRRGAPEVVAALKGAIAGADARLVVKPEYN